jgi:hypothetical protein
MLNKVNITQENILYGNTETIEKIQKTPEINSKVAGNQTKGQFLDSGIVLPHEDIILKGLKIVKENPSIGLLRQDVREKHIEKSKKSKRSDIETTFNHRLSILVPSKIGMVAIAENYKNKYNINIYIVDINISDSLFMLAQQLDNGEKIGIVLSIDGHLTPIIISKCNDSLHIVVLDGIFIKPMYHFFIDEAYVKLLHVYGETKCQLLYAGGTRQRDRYSCINDTFIILKDALRKPNLINELFANSKIEDRYNSKAKKYYQSKTVAFPKILYKTMQNKQLLDKLSLEELQISLKEVTDISNKLTTKTLKAHFNKYNHSIIAHKSSTTYGGGRNIVTDYDINWLVNFYLQIKAYRMLVKSFGVIDDGNGKINQEKADILMEKYVNPCFLIKS